MLQQWSEQKFHFHCILGWNMNIQIMVVLRNKLRPKKRQRSDFQTATFSFEKSEEEKLKKMAKIKYSEFLETLDLDSLRIEAGTSAFGRNAENITVIPWIT